MAQITGRPRALRAFAASLALLTAVGCTAEGPESSHVNMVHLDLDGSETTTTSTTVPPTSTSTTTASGNEVGGPGLDTSETGPPEGEETFVPVGEAVESGGGPEECRSIAASFSFANLQWERDPMGVESSVDHSFHGLPAFVFDDDINNLLDPAGTVAPEALRRAWEAAGFKHAMTVTFEDEDPYLTMQVLEFRDHDSAVAATRAHLHDLCESAASTRAMRDQRGVEMTSAYGPAANVWVLGSMEIVTFAQSDYQSPTELALSLERWLTEIDDVFGTKPA